MFTFFRSTPFIGQNILNLCRLQWLHGHVAKVVLKPANVRHWIKEYFKYPDKKIRYKTIRIDRISM